MRERMTEREYRRRREEERWTDGVRGRERKEWNEKKENKRKRREREGEWGEREQLHIAAFRAPVIPQSNFQ